MYKDLGAGTTVLKVIMASLVVAVAMSIFSGYEFAYVFMGLLLTNTVLTASYKYSIEVDRAAVFTIVFIFYICLAGYSKEYIGYDIKVEGIVRYALREETPQILLASCISVLITNIGQLSKTIKRKVDSWFIPMYIVVIAAFFIIELNDWVMPELKKVSYFFLSMGITMVCLYSGEKKQDKGIRYDIGSRGYLGYMSLLLLVVTMGGMFLPTPDYLPGAKWFQEKVLKVGSKVPTKSNLNRRPKMSEEILYRVKSDEPLYLRSIAYSGYIGDSWFVDINEMDKVPLELLDFDFEYGAIYSHLKVNKRAYVYEEKSSNNYLTTNGTYKIEVDDSVQSMGDINNIYFIEGDSSDSQRGYTIKYYNRVYDENNNAIGIADRDRWDAFIKFLSSDYKKNDPRQLDLEYSLDTQEYWELYSKYTQIPKELHEPFYNLASEIVGMDKNQVDIARSIQDYLKYSGGYKYVYGAKKKDRMVDTVYDFTFNGKEGICQDFASSMTLLCRSIGLPARYVVGYYSEEKDEEGKYVVRVKNAHAFVEVYITGYGWMLFDPTTAIQEDNGGLIGGELLESTTEFTEGLDNSPSRPSIVEKEMVYPVVILIAIWYMFNIGYKIHWKRSLLKEDSGKAIVIIYEKTLEILRSIDDESDVHTLREIALNTGVDISPIIYPYEQYYYGDKTLSKEQIKHALTAYNKLLRHRGHIKV